MQRDIYAYQCRQCGHLHYPFRMVCKGCRQNDFFEFDIVPLPKKGKLLTFTTVYNLPAEFEVGYDHDLDRRRGFTVTENEVTVIAKTDGIEHFTPGGEKTEIREALPGKV